MVRLSPILIGDSREAIYLLRSDIKEKRGTKGKRLAIHVAMHEFANGRFCCRSPLQAFWSVISSL